ncbi:TPA: hypothetical protein QDB21_005630 [Burkholderia vietnamiensis]|nr:hypothetical protein [Burkholderia vietnamiensis]
MRDVSELIQEANRILHTEPCGQISPDAIFNAVVALEVARAGVVSRAGARLEYRPAQREEIESFLEQYPNLSATATDIYRSVYSREPNAAEARSVAAVLRELGLVSARSNGRTIWRNV